MLFTLTCAGPRVPQKGDGTDEVDLDPPQDLDPRVDQDPPCVIEGGDQRDPIVVPDDRSARQGDHPFAPNAQVVTGSVR